MKKCDPKFNGPVYIPEKDWDRLTNQHARIRTLMSDGRWRTLHEISESTGDPAASISAQLRHLRKERFGGFVVEKRARGARENGLFEYKLLPGKDQMDLLSIPETKKKRHKKCPHCGGEL